MRTALEILVGYGLILATIWSVPPGRAFFGCMAAIWALAVLFPEARAGSSFGLRLGGIRESLWAVGLALSALAIAILCAWTFGTLHYRPVARPYPPFSGYLVFSLMQQFVLQNLFFSKLLRLLGSSSLAICAAALMMSMAHLPNPLLVIVTLLWGMAACWLFLHYRNLYVVASIHFLLGILLSICVPSSVQHNMRVGPGYSAHIGPHASLQDTRGKILPSSQHSARPGTSGAGTGER